MRILFVISFDHLVSMVTNSLNHMYSRTYPHIHNIDAKPSILYIQQVFQSYDDRCNNKQLLYLYVPIENRSVCQNNKNCCFDRYQQSKHNFKMIYISNKLRKLQIVEVHKRILGLKLSLQMDIHGAECFLYPIRNCLLVKIFVHKFGKTIFNYTLTDVFH